jgi:hypothetical protein
VDLDWRVGQIPFEAERGRPTARLALAGGRNDRLGSETGGSLG